MPDPNLVRVNNTIYSSTSTVMNIDGEPWTGFKSIDYEQKRTRKVVHAGRQDGRPVGWTAGKYEGPTLKLKFLKDSASALKVDLAAQGAGSFGDHEFTFLLQCVEPVIGLLPITLVGNPCVIIGEHESREEGSDEIVTEFDVACLNLIENGLALWSYARAALSL